MRLKSLEIKGFKSFANPTTLFFDENVTGVVGPNGSGKSNVVDAFRWVLGEQKSKELRLEQMGDVLFNGAEKKQQANLAEVSITFDNTRNLIPTDYNTVKISRRLYRSGESEYRINEVVCRLKDIQALLMDTGVGSNSYSIIELGMVDDILHDKENARRRMFEQAAGISKFKKRKKETVQKLALTNADLERIEDVLFEIEKNLKELEKQARRTKKFYEIKDKYKEASIILSKLRWNALEEKQVEVSNQIDEAKNLYNNQAVALSQKEALLESEKNKNLLEEKNLSNFQKVLNQLLDEIRQLENDKNLLNQKINYARNNITKAREDILKTEPLIQDVKLKSDSLKIQLANKEEDYKKEKSLLDEHQSNLEKIQEKFRSHKGIHQEKVSELQNFQSQSFNIEKTMAVLQNKKESAEKEVEKNEIQIQEIIKNNASYESKLKSYQVEIGIKEKQIALLAEKEATRVQNIEGIEKNIAENKEEVSKLNRIIDALQNELNLLESMVANLEGFPESVKYLHSKWQGKKVLLSDVINTKEKYRAAVEQFLQPYLNHYLVDSTEDAHQAISLLKTNQKGKAQFFILNQLSAVGESTNIGLTPLFEIIEVDDYYKELIKMLTKNVYLVDDQHSLYKDEMLEQHPEIVLIDSSGSTLRSKFQISGGSVGLFEGKKIGRKKRIEQLTKDITDKKKTLNKLNEKLNNLEQDLQTLKSTRFDIQIKKEEQELTIVEKHLAVVKSKLDNTEDQINKIKERNQVLQVDVEDSNNQFLEYQNKREQLDNKINSYRDLLASFDKEIEIINDQLSAQRESYNQHNIKLIQTENHVLQLKKEIDYQNNRLRDLNQSLYNAKQTLDLQQKELEESEDQLKVTLESLHEKYSIRKSQQEQLSTAEQEYFKARSAVNKIEDEIRVINKQITDKQSLINALKDKLNDFKFKKNSIKERLQIEFKFNIGNIMDIKIQEDQTETELEMEVEKYKRRLDNYGEINPMALEAYDEMEKRFVHIKEQREDIIEAKNSLLNTIDEIEETATKLFLDSFEQVRKHFMVVFRSLFTKDDDCDLVLEQPEDPLNSKIEIIAKPKGKRPKSLSQLSGGEKTLTATALLFSLYLLKPAPFCIFDEVDAPLDDTNIQKFANIIRTFSDKSQFIIVTHNKATMAEVDVLYGVYMQSKGVSSVSPVDFRNYEVKGTVQNTSLSTY